MKLSITLPLSLLAFTSTIDATCFTTGVEGDRTLANSKVGRMCDFLAGNYAPGQAKHHAFTYDVPIWAGNLVRRWDFWITNTRNVVAFNSHSGCVEFLRREINCPKGGESNYPTLGWIFHADPNEGGCEQNCEA